MAPLKQLNESVAIALRSAYHYQEMVEKMGMRMSMASNALAVDFESAAAILRLLANEPMTSEITPEEAASNGAVMSITSTPQCGCRTMQTLRRRTLFHAR